MTRGDIREAAGMHIVVETPRLLLRRWQEGDAAEASPIYAKADVMQYIPGGTWSAELTSEIIGRMILSERQNGFGFYPVVRKEDGRIIGHCGLGRLEQGTEIEVAYVLDSRHWHRGYAGEAAEAMVAHGFRLEIANRIVAVAFPENLRSIAVMKRIGMRRVGTARHFGATLEKYEICSDAIVRSLTDVRRP